MVNILDLFSKEQLAQFSKMVNGSLTGKCPSCGSTGQSDYGGCIINPSTNTFYCFGSRTIFNFTETMYLLRGDISCGEGRFKK